MFLLETNIVEDSTSLKHPHIETTFTTASIDSVTQSSGKRSKSKKRRYTL